eukprot:2982501-Pleurochrysis_carterae.AAC.1
MSTRASKGAAGGGGRRGETSGVGRKEGYGGMRDWRAHQRGPEPAPRPHCNTVACRAPALSPSGEDRCGPAANDTEARLRAQPLMWGS